MNSTMHTIHQGCTICGPWAEQFCKLITIRNSSEDNNIKPRAIKELVKYFFVFYLIFVSSAHNFVFGPWVH